MRRLSGVALIVVMSCVFARLPDIDQHLQALLRHRSILTHSVLPALSLLLLRDGRRRALAAGALIGTGAHLAADATSPAVGFGQVWTPWPLTLSLGALSPLWLAANAAGAFVLAVLLTERTADLARLHALAAVATCAAIAALVGGAGPIEGAAVAALLGVALVVLRSWRPFAARG